MTRESTGLKIWKPFLVLAISLVILGFTVWGLIDPECFCSPEYDGAHNVGVRGGAGNPIKWYLGIVVFGGFSIRSIYLIKKHFKDR